MTPMIDIIFQLIIFFLAVNQFQKAETDANVQLPEASPEHVDAEKTSRPSRVIINVRPDEELFVGGREIPIGELRDFLHARRAEAAPTTLEVWIRADRTVPYGRVEPILLACADVGVWKVGFKVITHEEPLNQR